MRRRTAWAAAVLLTAGGCGSALTDQQLIRANGQGFETRHESFAAAAPQAASPSPEPGAHPDAAGAAAPAGTGSTPPGA
ncbi:MAG: hypothetical protein ACRDUA_11365, partial [Micromonosporaceae bacterium]